MKTIIISPTENLLKEQIKQLEEEMQRAAKELDFERAMELRDIIFEMKVN